MAVMTSGDIVKNMAATKTQQTNVFVQEKLNESDIIQGRPDGEQCWAVRPQTDSATIDIKTVNAFSLSLLHTKSVLFLTRCNHNATRQRNFNDDFFKYDNLPMNKVHHTMIQTQPCFSSRSRTDLMLSSTQCALNLS